MKTLKLLLLILLGLIPFSIRAQLSTLQDPGRGLYVSNFFAWTVPGMTSQGTVDQSLSILTNTAKEDALLEYCRDNHITYLILYDVQTVVYHLTSQFNSVSIKDHFCNFLYKAKNTYCITKIGVEGSTKPFFSSLRVFQQTPIVTISDTYEQAALGAIYPLISTSWAVDDPEFMESEMLKLFIRVTNLYPDALAIGCPPISTDLIDVYVTELEFWNTQEDADCNYNVYPQVLYGSFFQPLLNHIDQLRNTYNSGGHSNTLYSEVYLNVLDDFHTTYTSPACIDPESIAPSTPFPPPVPANAWPNDDNQDIADFIDGNYSTTATKEADRILTAYYTQRPTNGSSQKVGECILKR